MKLPTLSGMLLVLAGADALTSQGITHTTIENLADVGPIHTTRETQETIPVPPIVGGSMLGAGIVILVLGAGRTVRSA